MPIQIFLLFASYAGIIGVIISLDVAKLSSIHWTFISGATILFVWMLILLWQSMKPKVYGKEQIQQYMKSWISQEGKTAIFSRDLTWATEDGQIQDVLRNKARRNELIICLPKHIELTEELASLGANIYTYQKLNLIPESRFTIANYGRGDATVAIGRRTKDGKQQIEEIGNGEHPSFAVTNDLITMLKLMNEGEILD